MYMLKVLKSGMNCADVYNSHEICQKITWPMGE